MNSYKILSLDGGGVWSYIQICALQKLYQKKLGKEEILGHEILKDFDLIAANSGGSLVLLGLASNRSLNDLKLLLGAEENRRLIFKKKELGQQMLLVSLLSKFGFSPKYRMKSKRQGLEKIFEQELPILKKIPMSALQKEIGNDCADMMVCTYDFEMSRAKIFRSNMDSNARSKNLTNSQERKESSLLYAAHGSSNAPFKYFDMPAQFKPTYPKNAEDDFYFLWDGALAGMNNPLLAAITEARANGIQLKDMKILSIGTGNKHHYREQEIESVINYMRKNKFLSLRLGAMFKYIKINLLKITGSILEQPADTATYVSYVMKYGKPEPGAPSDFIRLSPLLFGERNMSVFTRELLDLDMDITSQKKFDLIENLATKWLNDQHPNQAVQAIMNKTEYKTVIGHKVFSHGLKDFLKF